MDQDQNCDDSTYRLRSNPRNLTNLATGQVFVTSSPQQLNMVNLNRAATKITNLGTTDIFYGAVPNVSSTTGDLLPAGRGNWVSIPARSVIFVVCASGQTGSVSWADVYE